MQKTLLWFSLLFTACAGASESAPPSTSAPPPAVVNVASAPAPAPAPSAEPTDAELIAKYIPIWRSLAAARSGVSVGDVERTVTVQTPRVERSGGNVQLFFMVTVAVDWATVGKGALLVLRGEAGNRVFAEAGLPTGEWLTEAQLAGVSGGPLAATMKDLPILPTGKHLAFGSRAAAVKALAGNTGAHFTEDARVFTPPFGMPGHEIFMEATSDQAHCIVARLDLVTGAATRTKGYCGPMN